MRWLDAKGRTFEIGGIYDDVEAGMWSASVSIIEESFIVRDVSLEYRDDDEDMAVEDDDDDEEKRGSLVSTARFRPVSFTDATFDIPVERWIFES